MTDYTKLVEALRVTATFEYTGKLLSKRECALENLAMEAADAIEALEKQIDSIENDKTNLEADIINLEIAIDKVNTQLPKRGEWINSKERMRPDMCSVCGCIYEADRFMDKIAWNYCPNCGADMREEEAYGK